MRILPGKRVWLVLAILFLLICHKQLLKIYFVLDYEPQIIAYSHANQLDPAMVSAIVFVESRFDPSARSHKGAMGLMQIMPDTGSWVARQLNWNDFVPDELLNPDKNLQVGIWYLAYLKKYFHHDYLALASYNAGYGYVVDWVKQGIWDGDTTRIEQIPFPETKKYLLQIIFLKKVYHYLYPEIS